ncbi:MAG: response regulator [Bacteroidota bacterium]
MEDYSHLNQKERDEKYQETLKALVGDKRPSHAHDIRISIIDDDYAITNTLASQLHREGYLVAKANDGMQGLGIVRGDLPHLIILDMMMPDKNGEEMLKELRGYEWGKDIPVLILSNYDKYASLAEDPALAPVTFMSKTGSSIEKVIEIIRSLVPSYNQEG